MTLISRPDLKLYYGLLLYRKQQGIGKSFFGSVILRQLVGEHNYGEFSDNQLLDSEFTSWYKNKKLVLNHEIYQGGSKRAYNKLKTIITDPQLKIHEKFMTEYSIDNWLAGILCSNEENALKMDKSDDDDRRWFVLEIQTRRRPDKYWRSVHNWLRREDGFAFVFNWCNEKAKERDEHGNLRYVIPEGRIAPESESKTKMMHNSLDRERKFVDDVFTTWREMVGDQTIVTTNKECLDAIRGAVESNPAWRPLTTRLPKR